MKKLWQSAAYKKFHKKRSQRQMERRLYTRSSKSSRANNKYASDRVKTVFITAPSQFSLIDNRDELIGFFTSIEKNLAAQKPIYVDLSEVESITPDAIMYFLALCDVYGQLDRIDVSGKTPNNMTCRKILVDSGFFDYFKGDRPVIKNNKKILSIKKGDEVLGEVAQDIIGFGLEVTDTKSSMSSKRVYTSILECMANTREHAYEDEVNYIPHWWLIAVYEEEKEEVRFCILDYGVGIAATLMRKNVLEKLQSMISLESQSKLIFSALEGEFRTSTGKANRGKGLPKIYDSFKKRFIGDLIVLSDKAVLDFRSDEIRDLRRPFKGTLFSWTLKAL